MIDVIIPVIDNPSEYLKSIQAISQEKDVRLIIGITSSILKTENFSFPNADIEIFKDGSCREEIINALQQNLKGGQVFIARKPFTKDEFDEFVNSGSDIALCEKPKRNKFVEFFYFIWAKIIKWIFGVRFFKGDTSLIYFNSDLGQILTGVSNLSFCTRVDRWKGVEQSLIKTSYPPVKPDRDKLIDLNLILSALLSITIGASVTSLVCLFAKINIISIMLLACLDCICLLIAVMLIITSLFNNKIGKRNFLKAIPAMQEKGE